MRAAFLLAALGLSACSGEANHLGNPLLWPVTGAATAAENAAYQQRRGQVEVFVKTNHPALMAEIDAGGGPVLDEAMDLAGIPPGDRPARRLQLGGDRAIYADNPGALVVALMVYGG